MRLLILGDTGLVGQAIVAEAESRGHAVTGAARHGRTLILDATDAIALRKAIAATRPDAVINCVNYGSIEACAADPGHAYRLNARVNGHLATFCGEIDALLVAIGTDHYFTGDGSTRHDEQAPVKLVNDYALTKYAGERLALTWSRCLAVRTNVTGPRGWSGRPTFFEWALEGLRSDRVIDLFDDYYCSTIDAGSLAGAVVDLLEAGTTGVFNVACRDVASKRRFVLDLAKRLSLPVSGLRCGSVRSLAVPRAESAGLDVTKAETALGRALPSLDQVIESLARQAVRA